MMPAPKPMLATPIRPDTVAFPCFVQPKLDGIRCLWDGSTAWTRSGRRHTEPIQRLFAQRDRTDVVLDGELVLHLPGSFDDVLSTVTRETGDASGVRFAPFDAITASPLPFRERLDILGGEAIPTHWVRSASELEAAMDRFVHQGYEGLIYRDPDAAYTQGRTRALQKYKRFHDAEFLCTDVIEASGKDRGTGIVVCRTAGGAPFRVRPEGNRCGRARLLANRESLIGRYYTVRYQSLTARGVPRFPIGVAFR